MRARLLMGLAALVLVVAACGGGSVSGDAASTDTQATDPESTDTQSTDPESTDTESTSTTTATPRASTTTTPTPEEEVTSGAAGTVDVTQHQTACCYIEGQISFLRLTDGDGAVLVDRGYQPRDMKSVLETRDLPPGTYTLESWQQPCSGSCPELDDEGQIVSGMGAVDAGLYDQCSAEIEVTSATTTAVLVEFAPGEGCTIEADRVEPGEAPDAAGDLDCPDDARMSMVIDYVTGASGADSALEAVEAFDDRPEGDPVELSRTRGEVEFGIVDSDGERVATVWTFRGEGGWLVEGTETCADG